MTTLEQYTRDYQQLIDKSRNCTYDEFDKLMERLMFIKVIIDMIKNKVIIPYVQLDELMERYKANELPFGDPFSIMLFFKREYEK